MDLRLIKSNLRQEVFSIWGPADRVQIRVAPTHDMGVHFIVMGKRHPYTPAYVPVVPASGAVSGKPGVWTPTGAHPPASVPALQAHLPPITATPNTAWPVGEFVIVEDGNNTHWDGTQWRFGKSGQVL